MLSRNTSEEKTREILKKVRQIEIKARTLLDDALSGAYESLFKGQGLHFDEIREYMPGDEVRLIDWNVTAKMDKPFIKVFKEERELTLIIAIDISGSSNFGSNGRSKREFCAELASLLAFSAARNNDKVGLFLFSDRVERFIPPQKGKKHLLRIIRDCLFFEAEGKKTDIASSLTALSRLQKRKAIVFLMSDFIDDTEADCPNVQRLLKVLSAASRRHDLICNLVYDKREKLWPEGIGYISMIDAETGKQFWVNSSSKVAIEDHLRKNEHRIQRFSKECKRVGIDMLPIEAGSSYAKILQQFFNNRIKAKR